jgi:hypothetical protein
MEDGYPDDWVPAEQTLAPDGYSNDWMVPTKDGYPNDWIPAEKTLAPDGYPNDWVVPANSGVPTVATSQRSVFDAGHSPINSPNSGLPWPTGQTNYWQPVQSTQQGSWPSTIPVSGTAQTRPWWVPAPAVSGWEPWADEFIKGMQGLYNYFRSRSGAGNRGGDDENQCFDRWNKEIDRCPQFRTMGLNGEPEPRYEIACRERARARYNLCLRNGGRPDPAEPDEFGWHDIPPDPASSNDPHSVLKTSAWS